MGHVLPSVAVMQAVSVMRPEVKISFVVSSNRKEVELLRREGFSVTFIHAPKSPRGISLRLLIFPLLFPIAIIESFFLLLRNRPHVIFSKGGFVSVPVCMAAWVLGIPIVLHESDSVFGAGNRFIARLASAVCTGFPLGGRTIHTGNPVRPFVLHGSKEEGRKITGFSGGRPVVLIMGGSQGARAINEAITSCLSSLAEHVNIIHLTGEGKPGASSSDSRYWQKSYVTDELPHLYALADLVVSRAGAGSLSELAALSKPAIIIPLAGVAHDHQLRNAEHLKNLNAIELLPQRNIGELPAHVNALLQNAAQSSLLGENLHRAFLEHAAEAIARVLLDTAFSHE